jgi:hypothetical protein
LRAVEIDDLGCLVSQFVEERIGDPNDTRELSLWLEAVYAALFSVAFEILMRLSSARESAEHLESATKAIIKETCDHAANWIRTRLMAATSRLLPIRVDWDVAEQVSGRLALYFNVAYEAMADKGYEKEIARSHACFTVLSESAVQLVSAGEQLTSEECRDFVTHAVDICESMSCEVNEALDRKLQ